MSDGVRITREAATELLVGIFEARDCPSDEALLVAEGLVFRRHFSFAVFELALPTLNVGLNSTSLALAKVVEFEEGTVLFAVVESGFDHVT